jgi:hypothetical protein
LIHRTDAPSKEHVEEVEEADATQVAHSLPFLTQVESEELMPDSWWRKRTNYPLGTP